MKEIKPKYFKNEVYLVEVKQSSDGLGVIIDVFNKKTEDLIDTFTFWNDDIEE